MTTPAFRDYTLPPSPLSAWPFDDTRQEITSEILTKAFAEPTWLTVAGRLNGTIDVLANPSAQRLA
jgi:hypothetical protein